MVAALKKLFEETSEALGGGRAPTVKKREIEDNSKKLGGLLVKLNAGDVSPQVSGKLQQLTGALTAHEFESAMKIQVQLLPYPLISYWFWSSFFPTTISGRSNCNRLG